MKKSLCLLCVVAAIAVFSPAHAANSRVKTLPLTLAATNSGTIALPGQEDRFSFTGTLGQRLYYDALDLDFENIAGVIYAPSGVAVPWFAVNHSTDSGPHYLPETGTYTLVLKGVGDTTGDYNFRLLDLANATLLGYGTNIAGQLIPQSSTVAYRFSGTLGQRLSLTNIAASSGNANWRLIAPANQVLFNTTITTTPDEVVLPGTGTYVLLVEGSTENIGTLDYVIRINLIDSASGGTAGFGTIRSGATALEQTNAFNYTAPAGTVVFFDALTNVSPVTICLYDPAGVVVPGLCVGGSGDSGPFILPRSGTYRLEVVGYDVGDYHFRLVDAGTATALTMGTTYSQTITLGFRTDLYRFTGSIGQRLAYDSLDPDGDAATVRMVQPDGNTVFFSGSAGSDVDTFALTVPGDYLLALESQSEDPTVDYSFRLIDMAQSPTVALTLGATVNGALNPGTSANWYRFSGTAGQRVYFDGADTNTAGYFILYGPQNEGLTANGLMADLEHVLPQTGTYLLVAANTGNDPSPLPYSFRTIIGNTTTNALTLGNTVTGTIGQAEEHRYTFAGAPGQVIFYDALDADVDSLNVFLVNPLGGVVFLSGDAEADGGPFLLAETGTYTLVVRGNANATGTYRFRMIDLASPPALALNTTVNGTLSPGTTADWYRVSGTAGQRLYFDGAATNTAGIWYLYGANAGPLTGASLPFDHEYVVPFTGSYLLQVYNSGGTTPIPYSIRVTAPGTNVVAYVLGTGTTNSIATPGELHRYVFSGTAGQRLFYDALEADFDQVSVHLEDAAGNTLLLSGNADNDAGPFTLPHTGTYTLVFGGVNDAAADYRFRLLDLALAPSITYGATVTSQLSPQIETDLYRINGAGGQRISIASLGASSANAVWYLVGPDNSLLLGQGIQTSLGDITLPVSGTYALEIIGGADLIGTLDYQFRVSLLSSSNGTPAGFDITYEGTTTLDQTNAYTYTGTAGQPVYFDNLTNTTTALYQLVAPDGTLVFNFFWGADAGPYFLHTNGTYTLNVIGTADGGFHFQLVNLAGPSVTNLAFATTYQNTMAPGFRTDIYRFTGANGQRLAYDSLEYEFENVFLRLVNPNGAVIFLNGNSDSDSGPFTLNLPGTYYLIMESYAEDPTVDYRFRLIDLAQAPVTTLVLDTQINGNLDPGTRSDVYRLNGTAGQRLYFDAMPTNPAPAWYLYGPQDQYLNGSVLHGDFEVTLPQTGQYLLLVGFGSDTNPAPYSVRVVTPTDTTNAMTIGPTVSSTLGEAAESDYYTFTGTAGQRLYYDALQYDFEGINARLIDPSGAVVFDRNTDSEAAPFTLALSGTYLLRIYSGDNTTGSYSFRFLDAAAALLLAYDTVITNNVTNFSAVLYRVPATPGLRLYVDALSSPDGNGLHYLYDVDNGQLNGTSFGFDFEATPLLAGTHLLVLNTTVSPAVPYSVQIIPGNHAPILAAIGNRVINEESNLTFTATTTDVELPNDVLTWSLAAGAPLGANINPTTGVFSWTPTEAQGSNTYTVTVRVRDDGIPIFEDSETISITVNEVNKPPVLTLPSTQTIDELTPLSVSATATDPDLPLNALTFELVSGPGTLTVSAAGAIAWTPSEAQGPGTYPVVVRVFDSNPLAVNATSLSVTGSFNVVVNEINVPPTFTGPGNLTLVEQTPLTATATATDSDLPPNPFSFTLISGPNGLTVQPDGVILWTPTEQQGSNIHTVSIRVTDSNVNAVNPQQMSATNTFTITVLESNRPPVLTLPSNQTLVEETPLSLTATATDPDDPANALTFALVSGPGGLNVAAGGAITWTPTEAQGSNAYTVTVRVTDNNPTAFNTQQLSVTNSFVVTVLESNRPPVFTGPGNQTVVEENPLNATATATDPDDPANALTYALLSGPGGLNVAANGAITWTPTEGQGSNAYTVTVRVTDNNPTAFNTQQLSATNSFLVTVLESNRPPALTLPGNQTLVEETPLSVTATATDPDDPANAMTFALVSGPSGLNVAANGAITWTPNESQGSNTYTVTVRVTDSNPTAFNAQQLSVTNSFLVTVLESNRPPTFTGPANQTVVEEVPLNLSATATDPDDPANALTFALVTGPVGLNVAANGVISWTPTEAQGSNAYTVTVRVTDNNPTAFNAQQLSATNIFTVTVLESNRPPMLTGPGSQTLVEETPLNLLAAASDLDGPPNALTFALISGPLGLNVAADGTITWTPSEAQGSNIYTVTLRVTDNNPTAFNAPQLSGTNSFTVTVLESNRPPVFTGPGNLTVAEENLLSINATATDPDDPVNALTYALISGPPGLNVAANGAITWTPTAAQGPNLYTVIVRVTDNNPTALNAQQLSATNSFTVNVVESTSNLPPMLILPATPTVPELVPVSLTITATDPDGPASSLTFGLVSGPGGLTVAANGAIAWTPTEEQGPTTNTVTLRVTDSGTPSLSHTGSFQILVQEVDSAPALAALPNRAVHAGTLISLSAVATDTDVPANTNTFSLLNPPPGALINSTNGALTWTPGDAQLGTTNLQVRVADSGSPSLSATQSFNVRVEARPTIGTPVYSTGTVGLMWSAITNISYRLQFKPDLTLTNWNNVAGDVIATTTSATKVDTTAAADSNRVYRVMVLP